MIKVLLIEDNLCDAMLLRRQLGKWLGDFECVLIERLKDLSQHWQDDFDVIITDAHLPDAELTEIVLVLKNQAISCPYIIISGAIENLPLKTLALDYQAVLMKGEWQDLKCALEDVGLQVN
ncbi:MAG: response regulator transcription factor [Pseudomonadales bacterium]|nr:response regulator transcription factor [Pseudomonadales bacterium]